jgi:AhpC/TSA family
VERAIRTGDRAPDFTLPNHHGTPVSLVTLLEAGPAVVTFWPELTKRPPGTHETVPIMASLQVGSVTAKPCIITRGQFWAPIPRLGGAKFHAETHGDRGGDRLGEAFGSFSDPPPCGYFHGMVATAKTGELNLARTIWGLCSCDGRTGEGEGRSPPRINC